MTKTGFLLLVSFMLFSVSTFAHNKPLNVITQKINHAKQTKAEFKEVSLFNYTGDLANLKEAQQTLAAATTLSIKPSAPPTNMIARSFCVLNGDSPYSL